MIGPIRRISTAEAVAEHFLDGIRSGHFGPGDVFPSERSLQELMGVGRLAIREGLARLSALGIIQVDHGKGARVRESVDAEALSNVLLPMYPDRHAKALWDLLRARTALEGELAALAASMRTDKDIQVLQNILDHPGEALVDDHALAELDFTFHKEVARIADNAYLALMHEALSKPIGAFLLCYVRLHKKRQEVIDRHRPILEALIARDSEGARRAAMDHLEECKASVDAAVLSS